MVGTVPYPIAEIERLSVAKVTRRFFLYRMTAVCLVGPSDPKSFNRLQFAAMTSAKSSLTFMRCFAPTRERGNEQGMTS